MSLLDLFYPRRPRLLLPATTFHITDPDLLKLYMRRARQTRYKLRHRDKIKRYRVENNDRYTAWKREWRARNRSRDQELHRAHMARLRARRQSSALLKSLEPGSETAPGK